MRRSCVYLNIQIQQFSRGIRDMSTARKTDLTVPFVVVNKLHGVFLKTHLRAFILVACFISIPQLF